MSPTTSLKERYDFVLAVLDRQSQGPFKFRATIRKEVQAVEPAVKGSKFGRSAGQRRIVFGCFEHTTGVEPRAEPVGIVPAEELQKGITHATPLLRLPARDVNSVGPTA